MAEDSKKRLRDEIRKAYADGDQARLGELRKNTASAEFDAELHAILFEQMRAEARNGDEVDLQRFLNELRDFSDIVNACHEKVSQQIDKTRKFGTGHAQDATGVEKQPPAQPVPAEDFIGRFRILQTLGQGGFGVVYKARDTTIDRLVALKVLHRNSATASLLNEARNTARVEHAGIVRIYDVVDDETGCFIVQEFIDGFDLGDWLKQTVIDYGQLAELLIRIAEAIGYAHRSGLIHRDLKPANILIDSAGNPRIVDFGLSIQHSPSVRKVEVSGTPRFMAPEQIRGETHRLDGRCDLWALGVILYLAMTGRMPFRNSSAIELSQEIQFQDPVPPRQINVNVPAELQRICLRLLSKRMTDRYLSAADLVEDLRIWKETLSAEISQQSVSVAASAKSNLRAPSTRSNRRSTQLIPRLVPRGLRAFGSQDADFFPDLLPGPRDRGGLPVLLRGILDCIEQQRDIPHPVLLVYGPSGCGKSSLVRAGVIPNLNSRIDPVYVECSPDRTAATMLETLIRRELVSKNVSSLTEAFAELRTGKSHHKALLVFDQFEQWLHGNQGQPGSELALALRQCDGKRLQCMLLVRDDFWMAITQLMRELEVTPVEGENSFVVELFDKRHAANVLEAIGRAYGCLPSVNEELTDEQDQFLQDAVDAITENNRVVSIAVTLLGEMLRYREWNVDTIPSIGGSRGIGYTYLEEVFNSATAAPQHRRFQQSARAFLKVLLPGHGSSIRGTLRAENDLRTACDLQDRPGDFAELLRVLDSELRLITPADTLSAGNPEPGRSYQLTHDFLVDPLREWLVGKQRETLRGRTEMRFEELSDHWQHKRDRRHLPSLTENVQFNSLLRRRDMTAEQQEFLSVSRRQFMTRLGLLSCVPVSLFAVDYYRDQENTKHIDLAIAGVLNCAAKDFSVDVLEKNREQTIARLRQIRDPDNLHLEFRAQLALAWLDEINPETLAAKTAFAKPDDVGILHSVLAKYRDQMVPALLAEFSGSKDIELRARYANLLLALGDLSAASQVLKQSSQPDQRTIMIHSFPEWCSDFAAIPAALESSEVDTQTGLALALSLLDRAKAPKLIARAIEAKLTRMFETHPNPLAHSASECCLKRWQDADFKSLVECKPSERREWYVNSHGLTMLKLGVTDSQGVLQTVFVSSTELPNRLLHEFEDDVVNEGFQRTLARPLRGPKELPANAISWVDAAQICNWMSKKEGLTPCFDPQTYEFDPQAKGYRMLRKVEFLELATAGIQTEFHFGSDLTRAFSYVVFRKGQFESCGSKLPNPLGLFDMWGNVSEWTLSNSRIAPLAGGHAHSTSLSHRFPSIQTDLRFGNAGLRVVRIE